MKLNLSTYSNNTILYFTRSLAQTKNVQGFFNVLYFTILQLWNFLYMLALATSRLMHT